MLMNEKVMFDGYFCINSAKMKEIIVHILNSIVTFSYA